ncbi:MAG: EAL domain-containing protein [Betaproteobacteria bacterium]|nr:EAL domain-containing protein [Betaproteobacteria bacterium]
MNDRTRYSPALGAGAGIWDWNLSQSVRLSPYLETLLGFPSGSFPGSLAAFLGLLHPVDAVRVRDALEDIRRGTRTLTLEFRVASGDGQYRWFAAQAEMLAGTAETPSHLAGTMQELSPSAVADRRMRRQQDALLWLATRPELRTGPFPESLKVVARVAAETLDVQRVGIWLFDATDTRLDCLELFDRREDRHSPVPSLSKGCYPQYFGHVRDSRAMAIADAQSDPRSSELAQDYLAPLGISALLDAAIRREGRNVGVVCHEYSGPARAWTLDEQGFAASVADLVAELLEGDARRSAEDALRRSEERYRAFVEQSTEAIWRVDVTDPIPAGASPAEQIDRLVRHGRLAECNLALARMLGFESCESIVGRPMASLVGERRTRAILETWLDAGGRLRDFEVQTQDRAGAARWLSVSLIGVRQDGLLTRIWGTWRDVTDRRVALAALEHQSRHDALTDLPNRTRFAADLADAIETCRKIEGRFAVLVIDLDHFKEINDTLGHPIGDALLGALGPRLQSSLDSDRETIARLGGDEFAIVLRSPSCIHDAEALALRLLSAIRQPFSLEGARLEIGASIGISVFPDDGTDAASLLRRADIAMYNAKRSRSGYAFYRAEQDRHSVRRLNLLSELGTAIRTRQIVLHYQPKVMLRDGRVCGLEALCRWQHPEHGMVPPDEFIRLAEMGDLIRPLTSLVIDEALAQWARWAAGGLRLPVAVNLSPRSLVDDAILLDLGDALDKHGVPPGFVELELTESAFLHDPERALTLLGRMRALGVSLAMDDFGTGFSSLSYLRRMPIRALKIDKSFVISMADHHADQAIVHSVVDLARNLGLLVIAEGIESEGIARQLLDIGCEIGQGYWFARPLPADAVADYCLQRGVAPC